MPRHRKCSAALQITCSLVAFLGFVPFAKSVAGAGTDAPKIEYSATDQTRDARVLRETMISVNTVLADHPELANTPEGKRLYASAGDLSVLFERMTTPSSLKVLVSLRSYYFGEGAGEVMDCVLLEKGKLVAPYLRSARDECVQSGLSQKAKLTACLNEAEFADLKKDLLNDIASGRKCSLAQFY